MIGLMDIATESDANRPAYDKALDAAEKAANVKTVKDVKKAVDAYNDALKSLDDMDDDW